MWNFDYPDILDKTAGVVLPRLVALGTTGRVVWTLYALIPLLLIPAGIGVAAGFRRFAPRTAMAAGAFAYAAALAMTIGLARWPSVQWQLGLARAQTSLDTQEHIRQVFDALNLVLGRIIGEFIGELALNLFFLLTGLAFLKAGRPRWQGLAGIIMALIGFVAALRNALTAVGPIAEANNYILPLWLIVLGVLLLRDREGGRVGVAAVS